MTVQAITLTDISTVRNEAVKTPTTTQKLNSSEEVQVVTTKKSKLSLSKETKLLFLQCVRQHDAHIASRGEIEKFFTDVVDTFTLHLQLL